MGENIWPRRGILMTLNTPRIIRCSVNAPRSCITRLTRGLPLAYKTHGGMLFFIHRPKSLLPFPLHHGYTSPAVSDLHASSVRLNSYPLHRDIDPVMKMYQSRHVKKRRASASTRQETWEASGPFLLAATNGADSVPSSPRELSREKY
jgi:hypothetical protein